MFKSSQNKARRAITFNSVFPPKQTSEFPQSSFYSQHTGWLLFSETAHWVSGEYGPLELQVGRYWNAQRSQTLPLGSVFKEGGDDAGNVMVGFLFRYQTEKWRILVQREHFFKRGEVSKRHREDDDTEKQNCISLSLGYVKCRLCSLLDTIPNMHVQSWRHKLKSRWNTHDTQKTKILLETASTWLEEADSFVTHPVWIKHASFREEFDFYGIVKWDNMSRHLITEDTQHGYCICSFAHVAQTAFRYLTFIKAFRHKNVWEDSEGGGTWRWLNRSRDGESGGSHWHTYSHAQMHSGNTASVAIHPREKQTHTPSDSDEEGVGETPDWADEEGRESNHRLTDERCSPAGRLHYSLQQL